jgi:hypothetical protein
MSNSGDSPAEDRFTALRILYEELCKSHDSIAEFRAKLLALLPLASGTGLFAIIKIDDVQKPEHLLAIGIFGGLVAMALYLYEIRGIQHCTVFTIRARAIESQLIGNSFEGAFSPIRKPKLPLATNTFAAAVIYPATISVWAYVAFCGIDPRLGFEPLRVPFSLGLFFLVMVAGYWVSKAEYARCHDDTGIEEANSK